MGSVAGESPANESERRALQALREPRPVGKPLTGEQVKRIRRRLLRWGRRNFQHYSWRHETDPWRSLCAEVLLQRTRASQVAAVYGEFCSRFPTAESVASGGTDAVRFLTTRLGLHRRGPLLVKMARLVALRGGQPPESLRELTQMPGVGIYTAAAWLSLHRQHRTRIVDSNICRWLSRMTGLPYNRDPRHLTWVKKLAERLTPLRTFRDYNYAVLDFTMLVCVPRKPKCARCPLQSDCLHRLRLEVPSVPTGR